MHFDACRTDSTAVDIIGGDSSGPAGSAVGSADAKVGIWSRVKRGRGRGALMR